MTTTLPPAPAATTSPTEVAAPQAPATPGREVSCQLQVVTAPGASAAAVADLLSPVLRQLPGLQSLGWRVSDGFEPHTRVLQVQVTQRTAGGTDHEMIDLTPPADAGQAVTQLREVLAPRLAHPLVRDWHVAGC